MLNELRTIFFLNFAKKRKKKNIKIFIYENEKLLIFLITAIQFY